MTAPFRSPSGEPPPRRGGTSGTGPPPGSLLVLRAVVCASFLVGVQALLPLSVLRSDRPVGFGWHMYAHGPDRVRFVVEGPTGLYAPVEDYELFARRRPELRPERWAPEFLCERIPGSRSVRILVEGREPRIHRCGD